MRNRHLGRLFQFPLSRGCTPALYEEQTFWKRFSIPLIKRLYSLAIYFETGIFEYHFQFPLSSRCTLALYEEQAFWDTFFISICQDGVLSGIHMRNKHFGIPFSILPIKHVYSLALYREQAFWNTFFNSPCQ